MKNVHKINIMNKEDFVSVEAIPVDDYNQQHCYNYQQPGENNQHYNAPIQAQVIGGQQHPNPYNPNFGLQQQYPPRRGIDIEATKQLLTGQKWPLGLQLALIDGMKKCPKRYFIVDDSGSMGCNDGNMCIEQGNIIKSVQCSRWTELTSSLKFHALLAHTAKNPSEFRLLNGAQPIVIGENDDPDKILYSSLMAIFNESPGGGTPLCRHINEVTASIQRDEAELRSNNQKAVVIICTDGLSSDGDIITAMKPLTRLPVFVVIRLCTDDNAVVDYWSNVDSQLELELDVLDDFVGESKEVFTANPWLNYGLPLHRLREFGIPFYLSIYLIIYNYIYIHIIFIILIYY